MRCREGERGCSWAPSLKRHNHTEGLEGSTNYVILSMLIKACASTLLCYNASSGDTSLATYTPNKIVSLPKLTHAQKRGRGTLPKTSVVQQRDQQKRVRSCKNHI